MRIDIGVLSYLDLPHLFLAPMTPEQSSVVLKCSRLDTPPAPFQINRNSPPEIASNVLVQMMAERVRWSGAQISMATAVLLSTLSVVRAEAVLWAFTACRIYYGRTPRRPVVVADITAAFPKLPVLAAVKALWEEQKGQAVGPALVERWGSEVSAEVTKLENLLDVPSQWQAVPFLDVAVSLL